jgi:N-acetyl-anhydromuramyl-L-alanine amidase AmpD
VILPVLAGTAIMVAGAPVEVGRPVVLWNDPEGFDGYAQHCVEQAPAQSQSTCCARTFPRYSARAGLAARTPTALAQLVSQLVLHLDGCVNSRSCFYSMHDLPRPDGGCGLSAHFMIDADGTIYQTLDVLERAWHAEQENSISVGVEICNRGDAGRNELDRLPADYRTRPVKDVVLNGHHIRAFEFRPEQYESVIALARALVRTLPRIRPAVPERGGEPITEALHAPLTFEGIVGHFHVDLARQKWDPGAFDWQRLLRALAGFHFPVAVRSAAAVPHEATEIQVALAAQDRQAEERAAGFFPIAPGGLWHSGVHLRAIAGEAVVAPMRGRVVAARIGERQGSSASFVLLRHDVVLAGEPFTFFTLLAHLAAERVGETARAVWLRELTRAGDPAQLQALRRGEVALIEQRVEAGDVVGAVGEVHRGAEQGAEVHFEAFSATRPPGALGRTFRYIEAAADGPFARRAAILETIREDRSVKGLIDAAELRAFFTGGALDRRQALRRMAVRHAHEWGDRLGVAAYTDAPELAGAFEAERRELWRTAMMPYQFWTDALSAHTGLPASQTVYFFHPLTLLGALAAEVAGTALHWPARAATPDRDLTPARMNVRALAAEWRPRPASSIAPALLGPVVDDRPLPRPKSKIPLIVLDRP